MWLRGFLEGLPAGALALLALEALGLRAVWRAYAAPRFGRPPKA
jgi:hypothetical protein